MNTIFDTYRPNGFTTVNPYLFTKNPQELIDFLRNAFDAKEINRSINPKNGDIANCILRIGDSCFMISQARGDFENMRTSFYLFVNDVDAVHKQALAQGGDRSSKTR